MNTKSMCPRPQNDENRQVPHGKDILFLTEYKKSIIAPSKYIINAANAVLT